MAYNIGFYDLKGHFKKHVEGIGTPKEEREIESKHWKEYKYVTTASGYKEEANKNIYNAGKVYLHKTNNGVSINYQKDFADFNNIYNPDEYEKLLTTCVVKDGNLISSCFYKTRNDEILEFLNMMTTIADSNCNLVVIGNSLRLPNVKLTMFEDKYSHDIDKLYREYLEFPEYSLDLCKKAFLIELFIIKLNQESYEGQLYHIAREWLRAYGEKEPFDIIAYLDSNLESLITSNFSVRDKIINTSSLKKLFSIKRNDYIYKKEW